MASDINSELEFKVLFGKMTGKEKFDWMVKEIYFQSLSSQKLSDTLDAHSARLVTIENNCKKANCDEEDGATPKNSENCKNKKIQYAAYGSAGTIGGAGIVYGVIELVKVLLQRGGY